jgi:hypothetical protein
MKSAGASIGASTPFSDAVSDRQFGPAHAPDQDGGEQVGLHLHQMRQQIVGEAHAHGVVADPRLQQPAAGVHVGQRLGQQLPQEHDLDAAIAHRVDEGHVLDARLLDPDDVIEQQFGAIGGGQPGHGGAGLVDQHAAQLARLGMHAVGR